MIPSALAVVFPQSVVWGLVFVPIGAILGGRAMIRDAERRAARFSVVIDLTELEIETATAA